MEIPLYTPQNLLNSEKDIRKAVYTADYLVRMNYELVRAIFSETDFLTVELDHNFVDVIEAELNKAGWHTSRGLWGKEFARNRTILSDGKVRLGVSPTSFKEAGKEKV